MLSLPVARRRPAGNLDLSRGGRLTRSPARSAAITLLALLLLFPVGALAAPGQDDSPQGDYYYYGVYREAAERGDAGAQFRLGLLLERGAFGESDPAAAAEWYRRAAAQGHREAQYKLALLYQYGRGVKRNFAKAAELYRAAAEQGLAEAQHNLGYLYERGLGVGRNPAEAAVWYRRAAIQGLRAARLNLAKLYAMGDGVPPNDPLAWMWASLAAVQGDARAVALRDKLALRMTDAEREKGERLLAEWHAGGLVHEAAPEGEAPSQRANSRPR